MNRSAVFWAAVAVSITLAVMAGTFFTQVLIRPESASGFMMVGMAVLPFLVIVLMVAIRSRPAARGRSEPEADGRGRQK